MPMPNLPIRPSRRALLAAAIALALPHGAALAREARSAFRFGIVTDVQYADKELTGKRRYREAPAKLTACVEDFQRQKLAFVTNLGDLIDGNGARSASDLAEMAALFNPLKVPVHHVIGNHCTLAGRPAIMRAFKLKAPYYEFTVRAWRFVVLDGMDVSTIAPEDDLSAKEVPPYLARTPKPALYNGAVGTRQLRWLEERLADAKRARQRVIVLAHHPVGELWNGNDVRQVLERAGCVAAYFCGHSHGGGYELRGGIHYIVQQAVVEAPQGSNAYAVVEVYPDRLEVRGAGTVPNRTLML